MYIDYVRVYQRADVKNGVGCDPSSHPTADYIQKYAPILLPVRSSLLLYGSLMCIRATLATSTHIATPI